MQDPPLLYNPVNAKWSIYLTPLEPYLRIRLRGHGLPWLANPALFKEGLISWISQLIAEHLLPTWDSRLDGDTISNLEILDRRTNLHNSSRDFMIENYRRRENKVCVAIRLVKTHDQKPHCKNNSIDHYSRYIYI